MKTPTGGNVPMETTNYFCPLVNALELALTWLRLVTRVSINCLLLQHVGCDWVIDSAAKEDRCGMCHGDGSTCQTIKDEFNEKEGLGES